MPAGGQQASGGTPFLDDGAGAAYLVSHDGWRAWGIPRLGGTKLHELRLWFVADAEGADGPDG